MFDSEAGLGYVYFENNSTDTSPQITMDMSASKNISLIDGSMAQKQVFDLKPGQTRLFVYAADDFPLLADFKFLISWLQPQTVSSYYFPKKTTVTQKQLNGVPVNIFLE